MRKGCHASKSRSTPCGGTGWRSRQWCIETYGEKLGAAYYALEISWRRHRMNEAAKTKGSR